MLDICSQKVNLLSIVTPRILREFAKSTLLSPIKKEEKVEEKGINAVIERYSPLIVNQRRSLLLSSQFSRDCFDPFPPFLRHATQANRAPTKNSKWPPKHNFYAYSEWMWGLPVLPLSLSRKILGTRSLLLTLSRGFLSRHARRCYCLISSRIGAGTGL